MKYFERTLIIVLFASLAYLEAKSVPSPVTSEPKPHQSTEAERTTTDQPKNFSTSGPSSNNTVDKENGNELTINGSKKAAYVRGRLDNPNYFEGDLKIPQEIIDAYYEKNNDTDDGKRLTRAVIRDRYYLWPSGIVYYRYHSSLDANTRNIILGAIHEFERETCLRFNLRTSQSNYITFTGIGDGCASYGIGKQGGEQRITLPFGCRTHGIVLHEIGHAVGLWHEQSRPDRDQYVDIVHANIDDGRERQFEKRTEREVDYHGEGYDYGSIMHYRRNAFSSNGQDTIRVSNQAEYNSQGQPTLGQRVSLSDSDVQQLNRMYNCPGSGVPGILKVYVKYGRRLPDTDGWFAGDSDPYVKVTAFDDSRRSSTQNTRYIQGNENPNWYQWMDFGGRISWQYFEMSVWDDDVGSDDRMTPTQAFSVSPGYHSNVKHCGDDSCYAYVYFDYNLIRDGNECSPNPCVRGTCSDLISSYRCNCPSGYGGTRCEQLRGRLRIYARYGSGLPDRDGWLAGDSDPYVKVTAYRQSGSATTLQTGYDQGDESPEWYQWLDFGTDSWVRFTVRVYDSDPGSDDSLSSTTTYYLNGHISRTNVRKNCDSGYIMFDYHYQP